MKFSNKLVLQISAVGLCAVTFYLGFVTSNYECQRLYKFAESPQAHYDDNSALPESLNGHILGGIAPINLEGVSVPTCGRPFNILTAYSSDNSPSKVALTINVPGIVGDLSLWGIITAIGLILLMSFRKKCSCT